MSELTPERIAELRASNEYLLGLWGESSYCKPQATIGETLALCDLAARTLAAEAERDRITEEMDELKQSYGKLDAERDRIAAENAQLRRDLDEATSTNAHADLVRLLASNPGTAATELVQKLTAENAELRERLDLIQLGQFRSGWLEEADRLWTQRCDSMREDEVPNRPECPNLTEGDAWLWLTRSREILQECADATKGVDPL